MASCSTYLSNKILGHVFGKITFEAADQLELALMSEECNSDGSGGTELPSEGGYARPVLDNDTDTWATPSTRQVLNDIEISFTNDGSEGDWLKAVGWKLEDPDGNVYTFGKCVPPITVRAFKTHKVKLGKFLHNLT